MDTKIDTKVILLVEDNSHDEALTLRALRRVNVLNRIKVVRDGQQAIDYMFKLNDFQDRSDEDFPAVILLDINLPRVSGIEVLKKLRTESSTKLLPIVVLTSSDEEQDLLESYQSGANSYVRKPLDFSEFAETVARLGIYWLATNLAPPVKTE